MVNLLIFDWGGTVMADSGEPGPMYLWKEVAWVPGAQEALEKLKGYTCCIATNAGISDSQAVVKALKRVGADRYFRYVFTSRDLGFAKPDPRFFRAICEKAGSKPAKCIMTGNSYAKDICGAKEAGMKTVFYNPAPAGGLFPMADALISNMNQLPSIITSWQS
jgi:HAD superfamily hydrolase (TIGR01509 family)